MRLALPGRCAVHAWLPSCAMAACKTHVIYNAACTIISQHAAIHTYIGRCAGLCCMPYAHTRTCPSSAGNSIQLPRTRSVAVCCHRAVVVAALRDVTCAVVARLTDWLTAPACRPALSFPVPHANVGAMRAYQTNSDFFPYLSIHRMAWHVHGRAPRALSAEQHEVLLPSFLPPAAAASHSV